MFWAAQKLLYTTELDFGILKKVTAQQITFLWIKIFQSCLFQISNDFMTLKCWKWSLSFEAQNFYTKKSNLLCSYDQERTQFLKMGVKEWANSFFFLMSESWVKLKELMSVEHNPFWYCEFLDHVFHYSTIISTKN